MSLPLPLPLHKPVLITGITSVVLIHLDLGIMEIFVLIGDPHAPLLGGRGERGAAVGYRTGHPYVPLLWGDQGDVVGPERVKIFLPIRL